MAVSCRAWDSPIRRAGVPILHLIFLTWSLVGLCSRRCGGLRLVVLEVQIDREQY